MNNKKVAKCLAIFATFVMMLALLVAGHAYAPKPPPSKPPFAKAYPAQINMTGNLTLKSFRFGNVSNVTINTNFTSVVPSIISPGEYYSNATTDVEFHGFATATEERIDKPAMIRFDGLLTVNGTNFWVAFAVQKPKDIPEGMYSANGNLDVTISQITLPPTKITMVMMKGNVTKFGENDTFGFLEAHAKIGSKNFTDVHTTFTLQPPPRAREEGPKNFSISFYTVTLSNATKTEFDYDGNALYVEGFWNVYNRTITVTVVDHAEETTVVNIHTIFESAPGKFNVTLSPQLSPIPEESKWKTRGNFTLQIEGLSGIIRGNVIFYHAKFADPGDPDIPRSDFNQDHIVDINDIAQVARAYGAKAGMPKYGFDLDVNSDFVINIIDLAKVGRDFGQEY